MSAVAVRVLDTLAGRLVVETSGRGVVRVERAEGVGLEDVADLTAEGEAGAAEVLDAVAEQIDEYLAGTRRDFDVPLDLDAAGVHDEFAREVYREIQHIPYGETAAYGEIGLDAGRPRSARLVGRLCGQVPASFVIPVHRVIRADGGLGGCPEYRLQLLEHERRNVQAGRPVAFPRM